MDKLFEKVTAYQLAKLLGIHFGWVYRWKAPRSAQGAGGKIPPKHFKRILEISKEKGWDITAEDLINS